MKLLPSHEAIVRVGKHLGGTSGGPISQCMLYVDAVKEAGSLWLLLVGAAGARLESSLPHR